MFSLLDSLAWHQRVSSFLFGRGGISFGTAMAISGAAASPNMGYFTSPATAAPISHRHDDGC